jgi:hypothetical protein
MSGNGQKTCSPSGINAGRLARADRVGNMPITLYLNGEVFEPETTRAMGVAFEKACLRLGLSLRADPATEHVARVIIELARTGHYDPERLYEGVLSHFGKPAGDPP